MVKPRFFARVVRSARVRHRALVRGVLVIAAMLVALPQAQAVDRIDPCEGYQSYVAIGGEDSGPATALKRVCETIGPVTITQPCLVYYSRTSDTVFPPDDELRAKLAAECEGSMPGGTALAICDRVDCNPPADPDTPSGPCRDRECVGEDLVLVPEPSVGPPADATGCAPGLECAAPPDPDPVSPDEVDQVTSGDGPALTDGTPGADASVLPPADSLECGSGLECRPEPDDPAPVGPDAVAQAGSANTPAASSPAATTADTALDLAFWQAIVDSNDPALFQAYLDKFPNGTFAPIAKARLKTFGNVAAPAATPPVNPTTTAHPAAQSKSPQELFDEAQAIMDQAYQRDVSYWDEAAQRAMPVYQAAGDAGWAPAFVELGALYESGIGTFADLDRARDYYLRAGRLGYLEGYNRALIVLDTAGNGPDYVATFLTLYRIDPDMALGSLDAVGRRGPLALQRHLQEHGYYLGALDGDFGSGSRAALAQFVSGAGPADTPNPNAAPSGSGKLAADLQQALARVGCYEAEIDGKWGPGSARAMQAYNLWNGSNYATGQPTEAALSAVSATPGLICGVD